MYSNVLKVKKAFICNNYKKRNLFRPNVNHPFFDFKGPDITSRNYGLDKDYTLDTIKFYESLSKLPFKNPDNKPFSIWNQQSNSQLDNHTWTRIHQMYGAGKGYSLGERFAKLLSFRESINDKVMLENVHYFLTTLSYSFSSKNFDECPSYMTEELLSTLIGWLRYMEENEYSFDLSIKHIENIAPLGHALFLDHSNFDNENQEVISANRPHITTLMPSEMKNDKPKVSVIWWAEIYLTQDFVINDKQGNVLYQSPRTSKHVWKFYKGSDSPDFKIMDMNHVVLERYKNVFLDKKIFLDPFAPRSKVWAINKMY